MPEKRDEPAGDTMNRQQADAAAARNDPARRIDEIQDGGKYEVNGVLVDADGKPLKK